MRVPVPPLLFAALLVAFSMPATAAGRGPAAGGAGPVHDDIAMPWALRRAIDERTERQRARLAAEARLPLLAGLGPPLANLQFPLRLRAALDYPGFHGTGGFVDLDPAFPNRLLDWNCGSRTYDLASGYNHAGTDLFSWPFGWQRIGDDTLEVVAAAPGTVIDKHDGEFDRQCGNAPETAVPNLVTVEHADGSQARYFHMKNGLLTAKTVGDTVAAGEFLGVVASSGFSSGPHLHIELRTPLGAVRDPYAGACNAMPSLWAAQRPYDDSALNQIATHAAPPDMNFDECGGDEVPHFRDRFARGERVYLAAYFRDQRDIQVVQLRVLRPDGSVFDAWTFSASEVEGEPERYASSFWYWWWDLPPDVPGGTWQWEVTFEGTTLRHAFEYAGGLFGDGFESP